MEQSYVIRNDRVIGKTVPNINYNYSTCPIGSIFAFSSERIPLGFFICDGASYKVAEYPDLYAVIGNTYGGDTENFNVPDYRETVLVGVGENTTDTIASHDVYELGEFKDDQLQNHTHTETHLNQGDAWGWAGSSYRIDPTLTKQTSNPNNARTGTTTHGKQKGVTYIIKAFHTNEGVDSGVSDDVVEYVEGKINDSEIQTNTTWSSNKINEELEDVRGELDIIVEEANKNTTINDEATSLTTTWSSKKTSDELGKKSNTINISMVGLGFTKGAEVPLEDFMIAISEKMSNNYSTIYKVNWTDENSAYVVFGNKKVNINGGVLYCSQSNTITNTWTDLTILYTPNVSSPNLYKFTARKDGSTLSVYMFEYPYMADTTSSTTSTYSSAKIDEKYGSLTLASEGSTQWLKLKLGTSSKFQPIVVSDQYGGKVEILGMANDGAYKPVKLVRHSYGDWTTHSATDYTTTADGDANYKIRRFFYYPTDGCYYLEIRQWAIIKVEGNSTAEMVASLPAETSAMTLIPESQFASKTDLATQTANRQVKTFDNSGSSTEKWYKLCSAITGGMGCNIKLTASRADSTATVQYFSALFRDSRYRYTSTCLTRERTVYESELVAEYSAYIVADANNDIWVHVPSYGKVIIEIDTRVITIDGTVGTPVKDYVYSSYESKSTKERLDRMNIKQFNQPGSNTSFKYVTITSSGSGLGGLELNVPYAGKYMFSTPKSAPIYFGSSSHKGYTLNGWAWSDDGKTLYLRVAGFAPFSISVLGSVPNDIHVNNITTISDMTSTAPEGVTFVSTPVYSNAVINNSSTEDTTSTWSSSKIASELKTSSDRAITNISLNTDAFTQTEGTSSWYYVKNGICYVSLDLVGVASNANVFNSTLPKPVTMISVPIAPYNLTSKASGVLSLYPSQTCQSFSVAEGVRYIVYFSYPIA